MAFKNRVRLPMQLHSAQFPEERTVFRKANGTTKTLSVVVRKQYELETDWLPEKWHERLKMALAHDNVTLEGERYLGDISQDGDYNIEWPEGVLHYPTAKAGVKVQVTPFEATNDNCQTCEEASQLDLEDDTEDMVEDTDYNIDVAANDAICCYPAVFSLISFNSDYLTSASINPATGVLLVHTGTGLVSANGIVIATYRVTCPNGGYDDADVYGNITGSIVGCLAPINLEDLSPTPYTHTFGWADGGSTPDEYYYEIYEGTGPVGTPIMSGTVTGTEIADLEGFDPGVTYYFQVRSVCGEENVSNFVGIQFTQASAAGVCGSYLLYNGDTTNAWRNFSYLNCLGNTANGTVFTLNTVIICALETSPGNPASITVPPLFTITYLGEC
jgi:hypothetical protein